ncbi:hypothetical protein [Iningainema tapete]|uniref:Uncharacterized protein n=1 Tax=Iningainema tapete BLCC-T55 TaxID=2748662 RepID=A0A8J7C4F0_9CYAN|nr:hypothetical protein [Iningainema tapete]MBD2771389.1 hypothetical protein [Iningainema tapete BLCC-T55]
MAKKIYSSVGIPVLFLLAVLMPTSVLSDAPSHLMKQQFRDWESEENPTKEKKGQPQVSSQKKPNQVQGINDPSSVKNSVRDGGTEAGTGQRNQSLPIPSENNTSPSGRKDNQIPINQNQQNQKNNPAVINSENNTSPSGRKDDQIPINQNQQNQKNNPAVIDRPVYSNALDALAQNPFIWLPLLLLLGLLPLLAYWFRRRRRQDINQYFDQMFEQKMNNNIGLIINKIANKQEFKNYIDQYVGQRIDQTFEQKIQNNIPLITYNIVNDNEELNQYVDQRLHYGVINNTRINNEIVRFVANSTEINNKFNRLYRDIDIKISSIHNEWNQRFISLVSQYVDELIHIIGGQESFNILIANLISLKVDELGNQIIRTRNELTVLMNNGDRHLYEWTLGELVAIKSCLTDRQVLVEQLASFSTELKTKLDCTPCVDINTFKQFKPISGYAEIRGNQDTL